MLNTPVHRISSVVFNRQSVQRALRMIIHRLKTYSSNPANGLVIFCGTVRPVNGREVEEVCEFLEPPLPIIKSSYFCDKRFHTELVESLYSDHDAIGYAIITAMETILLIVRGTQRTIVYKHDTDIATNTARGGQSANRLARIRSQKRDLYVDLIVDAIVKHLSQTSQLIISGSAELPKEVEQALHTDTRWHVKILGNLKIGGHKNSIEETIQASYELLHADEINMEKTHIEKLQELIRTNPDLLVFGLNEVRRSEADGLVRIIYTNDPDLWSGTVIHLQYTSFLEAYGGHIGVLYYVAN
jgi:peptide subunit release factor 1 (eRF1)